MDTDNNSSLERNSTGTTVSAQTYANITAIKNNRHVLSGMLMFETTQDKDEWILITTRH